jgi:hypothetical protein
LITKEVFTIEYEPLKTFSDSKQTYLFSEMPIEAGGYVWPYSFDAKVEGSKIPGQVQLVGDGKVL